MAAASSKGREIAGRIGKRLANQIRAVNSSRDLAPLFISRRAAHADSYYEKEIEEQVRPAVVPDHVIGARSDNYWGPHPTTGVFGPADLNGTAGGTSPASATLRALMVARRRWTRPFVSARLRTSRNLTPHKLPVPAWACPLKLAQQ
ncbi:hypothetical protein HPP92_014706 [Vanilla planifolia]|uniref:Late embryogenesis abundant protein n=1 Tax=Vanilla planifolia TaxID=51239 RepID=A0A835QHU9_VANPL|nr:hypothetical protein HPP92_014706 [Vanilla planifolia]